MRRVRVRLKLRVTSNAEPRRAGERRHPEFGPEAATLLDCMYVTNCAAADPVDCYCGTSGQPCQTGGANGACRGEVEAALESTVFGDVGARIGDPSFAGGVAVIRVDGSRAGCGEICGSTN